MANEADQESESVYYDEEVLVLEVLWRWLRYVMLACAPPLLIDRDAPLHRRLHRWRFIYGAFLLFTGTLFAPSLLAGNFVYLLLAPVFHVVIPVLLGITVVTGSAPGISYPILTDGSVVLLHALGFGIVASLEWVRRRHPEQLGLSGPELHRDADEFVVPMATVDESSVEAPTVPRMARSVSTAFIGETGSGKTSAMQLFAEQYPNDDDVRDVAEANPADLTVIPPSKNQLAALKACSPVGRDHYQEATAEDKTRSVPGGAIGAMFPFCRVSITETEGMEWGRNEQNGTVTTSPRTRFPQLSAGTSSEHRGRVI